MPAIDATGERLSDTGERGLERRTARCFRDRSVRLRGGNFLEHALRRCCDARELGVIGRNYFLRRLSAMAAATGNGICAFALVPGCARRWTACLRQASYGGSWFLRNPGRTRRRFRDSHFRTLSTGAN